MHLSVSVVCGGRALEAVPQAAYHAHRHKSSDPFLERTI